METDSARSTSGKPHELRIGNGLETRQGAGRTDYTPVPLDTLSQPSPVPAPAPALGPGPIPDGGLDAWLQVLSAWSIFVLTWGLVNSFGVFQAYYENVLLPGSSSSSISWIGSLQSSLLLWVGVVSGPLYDKGYMRLQVGIGSVFIIFGMFMTSISKSYYQLVLAQGLCTGIGMGFAFLPATAIFAQYFAKKRALALGIANTGSPLAGIVFPIIFSRLVPRIGFGWATRVIAFILVVAAIPPIAFMRYRVRPAKVRKLIDVQSYQQTSFILLTVASFFTFLTLYVAFFYIELFDERRHISTPNFAPYTVTLLNVGSVIGRVAPNFVADKLGSTNVLTFCTAAGAILTFGWLGVVNLGGLVVFALLYGLFSGAVLSLLPSALMELTPDLSRLGTRLGLAYFFGGIALLIGTPIAGAILGDAMKSDWDGLIGYAAASLIAGSLGFGAAITVFKSKEKQARG